MYLATNKSFPAVTMLKKTRISKRVSPRRKVFKQEFEQTLFSQQLSNAGQNNSNNNNNKR